MPFEKGNKLAYKHGHSSPPSPTYRTYKSMLERCCNPNHGYYADYGGRGIGVCDRWYNSFESFLSDMGERPERTTLDRIERDMGYEPINCRWSNQETQCNNRSSTYWVVFNGEKLSISQWARRVNISVSTLYNRLKRFGWPIERALTERPQFHKQSGT